MTPKIESYSAVLEVGKLKKQEGTIQVCLQDSQPRVSVLLHDGLCELLMLSPVYPAVAPAEVTVAVAVCRIAERLENIATELRALAPNLIDRPRAT